MTAPPLVGCVVWNPCRFFIYLFREIWTNNVTPSDWNKGLIVKQPKKGALPNCANWKGITLLLVQNKLFCRILRNRIKGVIDVNLRQEQAGFRRGNDLQIRYSPSATSLNRVLNGTYYVLSSYTSRKPLTSYITAFYRKS